MRTNVWRRTYQNVPQYGVSQSIVSPSMRHTSGNSKVVEKILPVADTVNKENFAAYKMSNEEKVVQALMSGSTANLFYASKEENMMDFIDTFKNCEDTVFLAKAVVYAREYGYTRTLPIAGMTEVSRRDSELFRKIVNKICRNPRDWKQFIDICRSQSIRKGIGRSLKREIINAIENMTSYHAIKYPTDVFDMINISRPHESVNPDVINYIKKNIKGNNKQILAIDELNEANMNGDTKKVCSILKESRLPYELVTTTIKMNRDIWTELLYSAPYFNLVRNINTFAINGVFEDSRNLEYTIKTITDDEKIKNSKMFPFRFYVAHNNIASHGSFNGMTEIKKALSIALDKSVVNIPDINERVCIASDVSGSMNSNVTSDKSVVQCIDLVALYTAIMMRKCKNMAVVLPFSDDVVDDLISRIWKKETVFDIANEFKTYGGTSLSSPVVWLRKNKVVVDRIIAFTDAEEWVGSSFIKEFVDYKDSISPECKAYLVKLVPYGTNPTPSDMKDVYYVYGWSENSLRYVLGDVTKQIEDINKMSL